MNGSGARWVVVGISMLLLTLGTCRMTLAAWNIRFKPNTPKLVEGFAIFTLGTLALGCTPRTRIAKETQN